MIRLTYKKLAGKPFAAHLFIFDANANIIILPTVNPSVSPKLWSAIYTFKSWKIHFVTYLNQCALIVCRASDPA